MTELNPSEQAAAEALQYICRHTGPSTDPASLCGECDKEARAVVAAVRGPMYAELSARVEAAMAAKAEEKALEIAAVSLETAAKSWMVGGHDYQGTSPALWMRDRAAALRAAERQAEGSSDVS